MGITVAPFFESVHHSPMSKLFQPIQIRNLKVRNRIFVSPMCQYSCSDGVATHWHLVHLGSRASGGAGLVMAEATAVSPEGRISSGDLGLWNESQAEALRPVTDFIHSQGAVSAIQLAHAGRKASGQIPWLGSGQLKATDPNGWMVLAPSPLPFQENDQTPHQLDQQGIQKVVNDFESSAHLALMAGFQVIEIHMAHGYLLHEFLSPLSNQRTDFYGGSLENRMRLPLQIAGSLRKIWPQGLPVFVRISATDWADGGWDLEQSIRFCQELRKLGIDLIDVSTGGLVPHQKIEIKPNYQVPFADRIRQETGILTGAVGLITEAGQAEKILQQGQADAVFMARELLRNPYWPLQAARELKASVDWPVQYLRAQY